ncbi:hypothetical protein CY34DRAFT_807352 [Suillus luteus UH-Slu-Lm8-n1]|uniref:Uncharacterized protein n=1 Tax=Suillus luteus UH-Slu-Lm8-n1 TaxID=930992 RepID=A0A0D0AQH4_9AGAM|nr:hypothetical protein CY34DRAFT_807352 [Suillus luteus UH-Slu-Lm8-n1]
MLYSNIRPSYKSTLSSDDALASEFVIDPRTTPTSPRRKLYSDGTVFSSVSKRMTACGNADAGRRRLCHFGGLKR